MKTREIGYAWKIRIKTVSKIENDKGNNKLLSYFVWKMIMQEYEVKLEALTKMDIYRASRGFKELTSAKQGELEKESIK